MPTQETATVSEIETHDDLRIPVGTETVVARHLEPVEYNARMPVLLVYTPYRVHDRAYGLHSPIAEFLAERGYHVVMADMIGTGGSSGVKTEPLSPAEGREAAAVVEWLADREWSNGRVGMFGLSYPGVTALAAAAEEAKGLDAIVPIHAPYTGFRDFFVGGAFPLYFHGGHAAPMHHALRAMPPSRRDVEGRWARVWKERLDGLREGTPWLFQYLEHDSNDEFWQSRDIAVDEITTPTFATAGYRDAYAPTTVEYFRSIDAPKRLLLGPWRHVMPSEGREAPVDFYRHVREWFDRFLKDDDNDATERPSIAFWTERGGGGRVDEGCWRTTTTWPEISTGVDSTALDPGGGLESVQFALAPEGLLNIDAFDTGTVEREYDVDHTVGPETIDRFTGTPFDTNADDARSLTFESEPLETPIELTGTGRATIRFRPTTPDPLLAVRIIDVAPDGSARLVTRGQLRTSHRNSSIQSDPVTPGEDYTITLPLHPRSHVFETGHRIRVAISGGLFPLMLPPRENGPITILSSPDAPSMISVPGHVHEDVTFDDTIEMATPTLGYVEPDRESEWWAAREHEDDSVTVRSSSAYELPFSHVDFDYRESVEATIAAADPSRVHVDNTLIITLSYDDEIVNTRVKMRASHDTAQVATEITIDDQPVFEETWNWTR